MELRARGKCPASLQRLLPCQVPNDRNAVSPNPEALDLPILCPAKADQRGPEFRLGAAAHLAEVHGLGEHQA